MIINIIFQWHKVLSRRRYMINIDCGLTKYVPVRVKIAIK